jgi:hypothetical protein
LRSSVIQGHENIFGNLSRIIEKTILLLTKPSVKKITEIIVEIPFFLLKRNHPELTQAALELLKRIASIIGPNILRGRIENHDNQDFIKVYDNLKI